MTAAERELPRGSALAAAWALDPGVVFLNHGSFGACPLAVLEYQTELRRRMESEPVRFLDRELPGLIDNARDHLATFIGVDAEGLVFLTNATTGVNTALKALSLAAGDEVLVTNHGYAACRNAVGAVAARTGARVVEAEVPFPGATPQKVVDAILGCVSHATRAAIIDHVSSPTGLVFPVAEIATELEGHGVVVIVDGAHAPGMVPLEITSLGASYYTGNCHKWVCAPKGAAFLWIRPELRDAIHPLVISHGASAPVHHRSRLHAEFDWTGTDDPSAWLSVPVAISTLASMVNGGWDEIRDRNRSLALAGRRELCAALGVDEPCPDAMVGSLAAVPLPDEAVPRTAVSIDLDPIQDLLYREHAIEIPVTRWSDRPRRAIRLSAQLYNSPEQFSYLAEAIKALVE